MVGRRGKKAGGCARCGERFEVLADQGEFFRGLLGVSLVVARSVVNGSSIADGKDVLK